MSQSKYFVIPFEDVPAEPGFQVWYATWSQERPAVEPGASPPLVVGVTAGELPRNAAMLGSATKDPPPPPPPLDGAAAPSSYQQTFSAWLESSRTADE